LIELDEQLHERGYRVEILAAGFAPDQGPAHPLLRSVGFIDKARDMPRFIDFVRSFHFGCLFSDVEAFGLSNVECQRLGVPVLTWSAGGIGDTVRPETGHLFAVEAGPGEMADVVEEYAREPETYQILRRTVRACAGEFSWGTAVTRFQDLWNGLSESGDDRPAD
jgi:glycosyltransferase involved in cell wall biosynthesis